MAYPLLIDAVADAVRKMPFDGNAQCSETARGMKQRLRGNEVILVAVNEQHRRARFDLGGKFFHFGLGRPNKQAGIADDCKWRGCAAQSRMQSHHGALAEADQRERRGRQVAALEFGLEKPFQHGRRLVDAEPALIGIAEGERKPLLADRRLTARLRRMWGNKGSVWQQRLPGASDVDEVIAVGAVAVQKYDKLARGARARLEA